MEQRPSQLPDLKLRIGDKRLSLDYDNTVIKLFGNAILNHVCYKQEDGFTVIYGDELLDTLHERGYPQYSRTDNPEWAVELLLDYEGSVEYDIEQE